MGTIVDDLGEKEALLNDDVAIIGMAGLFPDASELDQLWDILESGRINENVLPTQRSQDLLHYLRWIGLDNGQQPEFQKGAYLNGIDQFDYNFFGISAEEACLMDPGQRLFLQTAWKTMEDAGYGGKQLEGSRTGVFVGKSDLPHYTYRQMVSDVYPHRVHFLDEGNLAAIQAGGISYLMDWRGTSMVIDTAESSSLLCLQKACQALQYGECDQALVGTFHLNLFPHVQQNPVHTLENKGYFPGEAVVSVLIKPLSRALEDGDMIHAVVKGSAVIQSGRYQSVQDQQSTTCELLIRAWHNASIHPDTLSFIETNHDINLVDSLQEMQGIEQAFSYYTAQKKSCPVSSIHSQFGMSYHASGLVSLFKAVLSLQNKKIHQSFHKAYPYDVKSDLPSSTYDENRAVKLSAEDHPLRCGVSSYSKSGTHCHIVLEESPLTIQKKQDPPDFPLIFTISAKTEYMLKKLLLVYHSFLIENKDTSLVQLCYTLQTGRTHHVHRAATTFSSREDLILKLKKLSSANFTDLSWSDLYYDSLSADMKLDHCDWGKNKNATDLCLAYVHGEEVDWKQLYRKQSVRKMKLPSYPFEPSRCWAEFGGSVPRGETDLFGTQPFEVHVTSEKDVYNEEFVEQIMCHYLGIHQIDDSDDFYRLGGDSITAVKIINDLKKTLNPYIQINDLLENPVLSKFKAAIVRKDKEQQQTHQDASRKMSHPQSPLSFSQQRLFIMTKYDPQLPIYNMPYSFIVEGDLHKERFEWALNQLLERHETLRTSFTMTDSGPIQTVHEQVVCQLQELYIPLQENELDAALREFTKPFDLEQAPLLRVALVHMVNGQYALFLDMHHIISDGTSLTIFLQELMHFYESNEKLEPLSIQYRDYATQQRLMMETGTSDSEDFWVKQFSGGVPVLQLAADYPRPARKTFHGTQAHYTVNKEATDTILHFAQQTGVTPYVILLTVYHLLLSQMSGQQDIIIGSWTQGRSEQELSQIIGMFVQTIPLRNNSSEATTFIEFIKQVQRNVLQAFQHQEYPLEALIERLQLKRDQSRNPLFDVVFTMQNMDLPVLKSENLTLKVRPFNNTISMFDLTLYIYNWEGQLECIWEYNTALFTEETIKRMADDYFQLLMKLIQNSDEQLTEILKLSDHEIDIENVEFNF
ncbi:hypothetical protein PPYC1_06520 [Paenibacillus polymyxa]|uniref:condensation domain-containing protein n=1 Tax=Paenibacillus polymyxa TaxID=1406 RepID=UPI0008FC6562|nr:condensation domain-containing protein [Paenibacillus polymyxa]APB70031.1 hypothetical protein PPYC1_06520 [Paenibacillus polymyxa]